ncbi:hypothetical protein D4R52_03340 [bacterium]|nr:MAG: hypothetical protein D4R52_03340 [bacterium]
MINYTHSFIVSLIFTVFFETLALVLLIRKFFNINKERIGNAQLLFAGFFASFLTMPYVWYVFPNLAGWTHDVSVHYGEIFAFLLEALFYRIYLKTNTKNSLLISLICNSVSYSLGFFLRSKGLWFYW